jgi:hypothetical protein
MASEVDLKMYSGYIRRPHFLLHCLIEEHRRSTKTARDAILEKP